MKTLLFFVSLLVLIFPFRVFSETIEVCPTCPISSVGKALEAVQAEDTIEVKGGIYREGKISIQKSIHLIGHDQPVIDGLGKEHVLDIQADDVSIEGFVIQNSGRSAVAEYAGVHAEGVHRCQFRNNILKNNTYSFYLAKVDACLVENNQVIGNTVGEVSGGNGIHSWYSKNLTLRNNRLQNHRDGIYLEFTTDSTIEGNLSTQNIRYGLHFMYSPRNRYLRNQFIKNQTGVAVMYSKNIEMEENRFEKSWGRASYGLLLKDISDSRIEKNFFSANTVGIFADEISRDQFLQNTFQNNGWALNILGSAEGNLFRENNFIHNFFNVATNSRESGNTFEENYWSDYNGYDLNHDGRGDTPFRPMKIFSLWVSQYPELVVLLQSPVIEFLEVAERIFPILTPKTLEDEKPKMKKIESS